MKKLGISIVCLAAILPSTSCQQEPKPKVTDYSITKTNNAMSDSDIASCFAALGLHFERFTCVMPERSGIIFSSKVYRGGQETGGNSGATLYLEEGHQNLVLSLKEADDSISFSFASSTATGSFGSTPVEDYHTSLRVWTPIEKLRQDKQPIFLLAATNNDEIEIETAPEDIDAQVGKYDFAMVIYVSTASLR